MKCEECTVDYPSKLLSPFSSSEGNRKYVCGICALELSNKIHGIVRTRFDGEHAESLRKQALRWRNKKAAKAWSL
jgi:hypothetical protein